MRRHEPRPGFDAHQLESATDAMPPGDGSEGCREWNSRKFINRCSDAHDELATFRQIRQA
ncbi:MAG: hypothetical protein RLZ94_2195, partial [Actinomycetota bacterium]